MRLLRNKILLLLLFAMSFVSTHDYAVVAVDADAQYEICYAEGKYSNLDSASQMHKYIHVALDVPFIETYSIEPVATNVKPFDFQTGFISHISFVPQRPPIS